MVFLKLVHTEYQANHKTQSFLVKMVHLVPKVQTLDGHAVGTNNYHPFPRSTQKIFVLKIVRRKSIASLHRLTQAMQRVNLRRTAGDLT